MKKLQGKVVLITGMAQAIGAAVAACFAEEGAKVTIGDTNKEVGMETVRRINQALSLDSGASGAQSVFFKHLDVTNIESIHACVGDVVNTYGRIDILINNAGTTRDKPFLKMSRAAFMNVHAVNFVGLVDMIRAVLPHMPFGVGVILNASSMLNVSGNVGQSSDAASKAAVESLTQTLARELGRKGIRVNAVAPGFTDTPLADGMSAEAREAVIAKIPLGRLAKPEEIAEAYLYLATAQYVTGTILSINGGLVV